MTSPLTRTNADEINDKEPHDVLSDLKERVLAAIKILRTSPRYVSQGDLEDALNSFGKWPNRILNSLRKHFLQADDLFNFDQDVVSKFFHREMLIYGNSDLNSFRLCILKFKATRPSLQTLTWQPWLVSQRRLVRYGLHSISLSSPAFSYPSLP